MRHGRLIKRAIAAGTLLIATMLASGLPGTRDAAHAQDDRDINVRRMVLAEVRIQPGAQQLMQVTLANIGKHSVPAGLRAEVRDARDRRVGSPMTQKVTLPARDEERFLFKFAAPQSPGDYAVRFEVLSPDLKRPLIPGGPIFFSPFTVGAGTGAARPRPAATQPQQAGLSAPSFIPPTGLTFERPDLAWESVVVTPPGVLLGEPLRIKADLRNAGGDLAYNVRVAVVMFNTRAPSRTQPVSETDVQVLAPGERFEMEFETVFPDDALLGEYRIMLTADVADTIDELDEANNQFTTESIRLSRIKLIFPEPDFAFEEQGLFLFRWDSLRYDEFKVQISTDSAFSDEGNLFDLPQGEKWTRDKEIVPLEGELPAMAQGLMEKANARKLYWRVLGRNSDDGRTTTSLVQPFTITPEPNPTETPQRAPQAPQGPQAPQSPQSGAPAPGQG